MNISIIDTLRYGFKQTVDHFGLLAGAFISKWSIRLLGWAAVLGTLVITHATKLGIQFAKQAPLHEHIGTLKSFAEQIHIPSILTHPSILFFVFSIIIIELIATMFTIGTYTIALEIYDTNNSTWSAILKNKRMVFRFMLVRTLYVLLVLAGLLLFIVPGIIFSLRYYFASFILVDQNTGIIESFKRSAQVTQGYKTTLFGFILIVGIITNITTLVTGGITSLFLSPMILLTHVYLYRKIGT